jgi:hypothetical protein
MLCIKKRQELRLDSEKPSLTYTCAKFRNFSSYDFLGNYTCFDETVVAKIWLAAVNDLNSSTNPLVISTYYNILGR